MIYLYKQEIFKLLKRKSTLICTLFLLVQNIAAALLSKAYPQYISSKEVFAGDFASLSFITFVMIAASASIISSEFEYNTIKDIFYQSYSRQMVLISKWLTILTYSVVIYLLMMLFSLLNKFFIFGNSYSLADKLDHGAGALWQYWFIENAATFVTLWLLLSLVFLVAAMMRKGVTAILVGIIGYFVLSIVGNFMFLMIGKWDILKWNPLNFLNYPGQITSTGIISHLTHLSNNEMLVGSLIYILLFLSLGLYSFSRKEV